MYANEEHPASFTIFWEPNYYIYLKEKYFEGITTSSKALILPFSKLLLPSACQALLVFNVTLMRAEATEHGS
jgi:hypothetical protein